MESLQLRDVLQVGLGIFAGLVWLLRLEGRQNLADKRLSNLENENENLRTELKMITSEVIKELSQIKETVARIEGRLSAHNERQ